MLMTQQQEMVKRERGRWDIQCRMIVAPTGQMSVIAVLFAECIYLGQ